MVAFATQVKRRRGTTAQNDAFTGAEGEIVVDTQKHTLRVHDGLTQGGFEIARTEDINELNQLILSSVVPAGIVSAFAGTTPPSGWLKCDGSAISRERYADLFAAIGTTYGAGDGSTTFNLPTQSVLPLGTTATVAVFGNGKTMGISAGAYLYGIQSTSSGTIAIAAGAYGKNVGDVQYTVGDPKSTLGLTADASKSGIVGRADIANATGATAIVCIKY